jgi:hypothetical protein
LLREEWRSRCAGVRVRLIVCYQIPVEQVEPSVPAMARKFDAPTPAFAHSRYGYGIDTDGYKYSHRVT